ncbi:MAG: hypothetical protein ACTHMS_20185 [Jatrophihabitans sp.]|uniref:hypothetical protein n=1 Tax=Jatrophihabitans sp. TaxID=1932789 RepID=UPI003F7CDF8D
MTSAASPVDITLEDSHARLRGDAVEIVLGAAVVPGGSLSARLRKGRRAVDFTATADGDRIVLRGPRAGLVDGAWTIALTADGASQAVEARLLVQGARPLVLLYGARPLPSRLPTPHAAARASVPRRVAERALLALPPDRADAARRSLRKLAKRVRPS